MRRFNRFRKTQRQFAKFICRHDLLSSSSCSIHGRLDIMWHQNPSSNFTLPWYDLQMAILRVHVIPNARSDVVVGEHGGAVKVKLRAPAVEGKANEALVRFLAEQLKLSRNAIVLKRGATSRDKIIEIHGLSEEDVCRRLRPE